MLTVPAPGNISVNDPPRNRSISRRSFTLISAGVGSVNAYKQIEAAWSTRLKRSLYKSSGIDMLSVRVHAGD